LFEIVNAGSLDIRIALGSNRIPCKFHVLLGEDPGLGYVNVGVLNAW